MGLFSAPKVKPDPVAQAALLRQQKLADDSLTDSIQTGLLSDTRSRLRQFGIQPVSAGGGFTGGISGSGGNRLVSNPALGGIFSLVSRGG